MMSSMSRQIEEGPKVRLSKMITKVMIAWSKTSEISNVTIKSMYVNLKKTARLPLCRVPKCKTQTVAQTSKKECTSPLTATKASANLKAAHPAATGTPAASPSTSVVTLRTTSKTNWSSQKICRTMWGIQETSTAAEKELADRPDPRISEKNRLNIKGNDEIEYEWISFRSIGFIYKIKIL